MSQFYNNVKTAMLLAMMTALILWIGSMFGPNGLYMALMMAGVMNFVAFFFSDKIALMSMQATEVGQEHELYQIVQELTQRAGMPMPRVYVSPAAAPNAFATGRNPEHAAVCATDGLLHVLNRNEVSGVMAHELSHVLHRDILIQSVAATIGGAISMLGYLFMFGGNRNDREGGNPLAGLLLLVLGPLAAGLIQAAISRSREFNADKAGGELCGDPMFLAKIHAYSARIPLPVNPAFNSMFIAEPLNPMKSMAQMFQTHPPLTARLMNLIGRESTGHPVA